MTIQMVLLPVFVQVALTLALLAWTASARTASLKRGEAKMRDTALGQANWPPRATQIANSYNSQFQLPLLFYVVVLWAWITRTTDVVFVVLEWLFVLLRIGHAYVHTTSNYVPRRFMVFAAGMLVLLIMWVYLAVKIFTA
jgi:hypothetical protein